MRTALRFVIGFALVAWLGSCSDNPVQLTQVMSVLITPDQATIPVGGTVQLVATVRDAAGRELVNQAVTWGTSDPVVAAVSATGLATGLGQGAAMITASSESRSASVPVTVQVVVPPAPEVVVSDPLTSSATADLTNVWTSGDADDDSVAFASMQPGLVPSGVYAVVHNEANGTVITTTVRNGGFDPVTVTARLGDLLRVVVRRANGDTVYVETLEVREHRRPVIVRTEPPPGKRDVPLNNVIVVIASEPIAQASLTGGTLQLFRGPTAVPGRVQFFDSSHVMVQFLPDQPLESATAYRLLVTTTLRDLSGDALVAPRVVDFTTGSGQVGSVSSFRVEPYAATILRDIGTVQLTATARDTFGNLVLTPPITWSSSDPSVANVAPGGLVRALVPGSTTVTAQAGQIRGFAAITVADTSSIRIDSLWDWTEVVTDPGSGRVCSDSGSVVMSQVGAALSGLWYRVGRCTNPDGDNTYAGFASLSNARLTSSGITFRVLGCTYTGVLPETPQQSLQGDVVCGTASGTWEAVLARPVASVTTQPPAITAQLGTQTPLFVLLSDDQGRQLFGRTVRWSNDNPSSASFTGPTSFGAHPRYAMWVQSDGSGVATITATAQGKSGSSVITSAPEPASIAIAPAADTLAPGDTARYTATVRDAGGAILTVWPVAWSIANSTAATISDSGVVTGIAAGRTTLSAAVRNRSASADVFVTGVPLNVAGEWALLADYFVDDPGYGEYWYCLDQASYAFTQAGFIVGGSAAHEGCGFPSGVLEGEVSGRLLTLVDGPCRLTFQIDPGDSLPGSSSCEPVSGSSGSNLRASVALVRSGPPATLELVPDSTTLVKGASHQFIATLRDAAGHYLHSRPVTWSTADLGIANVSTTGEVSALGTGVTTVSASAAGLTATAQVRVVELRLQTVDAGEEHSCGLSLDGSAFCWGGGNWGELGDGTSSNAWVPTMVTGSIEFTSLEAFGHFTCGLTRAGAAYCWGAGGVGQLGDGSTTNAAVPTLVAGGHTFASLAQGISEYHICAVAVGGAAYCWGDNWNGQLGDGSTQGRSTPVAVVGGLTFTALTVGTAHTCGLAVGGAAYCWGGNGLGQLGDGTTTNRLVPTPVLGGLSFSGISAGSHHTCAVNNGDAYCWGANWGHQLGNGTTAMQNVPTAVIGGLTFAGVATGGSISCGVTQSGAAYCWGSNQWGQLGTGASGPDLVAPTPVVGALTVGSIRPGNDHTCALTTNGIAYCWGYNPRGELGSGTTIPSSPVPVKVMGQP